MFGGNKNNKSNAPSAIDSLIGADTKIDGNVYFKGGLRIDGQVYGNVYAVSDEPSILVVSEQGRIEGEVQAQTIVVNGTIIGPVKASSLAELQPNARIKGDVQYAEVQMHPGAVVQGRLEFNGEFEGGSAPVIE